MSGSDEGRAVELYRQHHEALRRYLVRFTGDADLAADVAQETFVRLLERPPRSEAVRGWLFRVATNLVRDLARQRSRRRLLLLRAPEAAPHGDRPAAPDEAVAATERRRAVRAALESLSEKERAALLMREEGFVHREIAEAVGTTTKSVGTLIARASRKLADRMELGREDL